MAEGEHPLARLLAPVEGRGALTDERGEDRFRAVASAFGRRRAAAAARGRLILPDPG